MPQIKTVLAMGVFTFLAATAAAQSPGDAIIHYKGIVVAAATLQPMAGATVVNRSRRLQVQCDVQGRFDIPAAAMDTLSVSHVGYETKLLVLASVGPDAAAGVLLLRTREELLPTVTVHNRISAAAFERDFANKNIPIEKPMRFWDSASFRSTMNSVSGSGGESAVLRGRAQHEAAARAGQVPQVTLFNFFEMRKLFGGKKRK
ncbi:hypothetical protein EPD60_06320 [Flaviaesturariibacter flavus]|uniref:Carboxypeptidase-like regulatory domain-containing protein n=1 Tax=Flaviaesturariibacter flavus TaxID=2502780 RepID=A0A4R1BKJ0_9BACT|nr:carboxypeptidase-like regulatory domain-containing protein [Flaviaesturariibacter flavus]TCJ17797.1 hypothetical protein EPD60_06320 [Flaviaesturariibacter flavus]